MVSICFCTSFIKTALELLCFCWRFSNPVLKTQIFQFNGNRLWAEHSKKEASKVKAIIWFNIEKLFFSLIDRCLQDHVIQNSILINLFIDKGCVVKVPLCLESISLVWHGLRAEKSNKTSIAAIWLDIANAHGFMPEKSIYQPLKLYGIDRSWIDFRTSYYNGLCSTSFSTKWWSG